MATKPTRGGPSSAFRRRAAVAAAVLTAASSLTACSALEGTSVAGPFPSRTVEIMVPAAPGGGWDLTAREMQKVIRDDDLVDQSVEVMNVPGAGGAIGISRLVTKQKRDPHSLMVAGLVMVGALVLNQSEIDLTDTTPLAVMTAEAEAIVVPADSPYQTLKQLVDAWLADPTSISWGGGTIGGSDHMVVGLLAEAAGGDPAEAKYVSYSGGGEAKAGILSGDVTVGVSGISEFEGDIESGDMRLLAVSSPEPLTVAGEAAPTIHDAGYDVDLMNWRVIVAPPDIPNDDREKLLDLVDELHDSPAWKETLERQGWTDFYKTGDEAEEFIASETARVEDLLKELGIV